MTMIVRSIGNDGVLEEMIDQGSIVQATKLLDELVAANPNSELAVSLRSLKTSGAAASNRALPASMFERGVAAVQGGNDSFTRRVMAGSRPVAAKGFDLSKSGNWLGK